MEFAAYFVASEALANVAKHARASAATIRLRRNGSDVEITITDDGVGGADPGRGTGLQGLTDRVEALGGRLDVGSPAEGGTVGHRDAAAAFAAARSDRMSHAPSAATTSPSGTP